MLVYAYPIVYPFVFVLRPSGFVCLKRFYFYKKGIVAAMKIVNVDSFKSPKALEIVEGKLYFVDRYAGTYPQQYEFPLQFEMGAIFLCHKGRARFTLDDYSSELSPDDCLFIAPDSILEKFEDVDGNCDITIAMIAAPERYKSIVIDSNLWDLMRSIRKQPVLKLNSKEIELALAYKALVSQVLQIHNKSPFNDKVLGSLADAFFNELLNILSSRLPYMPRQAKRSRGQRIFLAFIDEINANGGKYNTVESVADKLCVSTKYLARVVKQNSGMSPSAWMDEYTMRAIIADLRHSNKSMKALSMAYGFPNPSSFGTFSVATPEYPLQPTVY